MEELGITIKFQGETIQFDRSVSGMEKAIRLLKQEVGMFNKELKFNPKNVDTLNKKMENLKMQEKLARDVLHEYVLELQQLSEKGETSGEHWNDTKKKIKKCNEEIVGIEKQMSKVQQAIDEATERFQNFSKKITDAGQKMSELGDKLAPVSRTAQNFLKGATSSIIDFEDAFADVEKTVEANPLQFIQIEQGLRDLAREVPTTASELAKIAGLAGQMGVQADDIVLFTKAMVDFGNATNITAEEATQDIAQIYNVIGKGGDYSDLDNLLSTIVDLGNNSATTERDIVEMFRNIASASSRVGMTEQQMVALASTLSSLGLDKGGASAISNIMTQIDMAVDTNSKKLQDWADASGLSVKEFSTLWKEDAGGALAVMLENLKKTADEGGSLNEIFDELGIKELRRVDTLGRLVNASDVYNDSLNRANNAYEEGSALSDEARKRYKTLASQIQILKNNLVEFALSIGEILKPYIEWLVQSVGDLVDWLNGLDSNMKSLIARTLVIVAVLAPLLTVMGKTTTLLGTILPKVWSVIKAVFDLKGTLEKLWLAIAKIISPVMAFIASHAGIILAIIAIVVALKTLYENCEWFRKIVEDVVKWIKNLWEQFKQTNWIDALGEKFGWLGSMIGGIVEVIKVVAEWFTILIGKAGEFLGLSGSLGSAMGGGMGGGAGMFSSGGYMSGGITLNNTFTINNAQDINETVVRRWADVITDQVNENLGRMI